MICDRGTMPLALIVVGAVLEILGLRYMKRAQVLATVGARMQRGLPAFIFMAVPGALMILLGVVLLLG